MTKADLVNEIAISTGFDKKTISIILESFIESVKKDVTGGEAIFLRVFGSFGTKMRAAKVARNITKSTSIKVPQHRIPLFKPSEEFKKSVRNNKI